MKNLKLFPQDTDYQSFITVVDLPNVSYVEENNIDYIKLKGEKGN